MSISFLMALFCVLTHVLQTGLIPVSVYFDLILQRCWKELEKTMERHSLPSLAGIVFCLENFWLGSNEVQGQSGSFLLYLNMLLQC